MLAFISFLLVCIGSFNWFCIGILQYDFVAGLFGSQSNVFSRIIYVIVGVASIIVIANLIKNKGKFVISFKKANKEYNEFMEEKKEENRSKALASTESAEDNAIDHKECECGSENCRDGSKECHYHESKEKHINTEDER